MQRAIRNASYQTVFWKSGFYFVTMLIFLDLYLIIRQPFKPQQTRLRYYVLAMLLYMTTWLIIHHQFLSNVSMNKNLQLKAFSVFVLFCIMTFCLILTLRNLIKQGTNKNLRKQILFRYVLLFLAVIPMYFVLIASGLELRSNDTFEVLD